MTIRSSDESRQHYIEKMGRDLGEQYAEVWQEVARIYSKWTEYVDLFGQKPERIHLLNKAAPHFFGLMQDVLWDDVLLHLARLTDPPKSMGKSNLTIHNFPLLIADEPLKARVSVVVDRASRSSAFCREWRNRRLAHNDLELALKKTAVPLKGASRLQVRAALESIEDVLKEIHVSYFDAEVAFDVGSNPGGAVSLLHMLYFGVRARERYFQQLKQRITLDDDYPDNL